MLVRVKYLVDGMTSSEGFEDPVVHQRGSWLWAR